MTTTTSVTPARDGLIERVAGKMANAEKALEAIWTSVQANNGRRRARLISREETMDVIRVAMRDGTAYLHGGHVANCWAKSAYGSHPTATVLAVAVDRLTGMFAWWSGEASAKRGSTGVGRIEEFLANLKMRAQGESRPSPHRLASCPCPDFFNLDADEVLIAGDAAEECGMCELAAKFRDFAKMVRIGKQGANRRKQPTPKGMRP
jgi:hypothetical protein